MATKEPQSHSSESSIFGIVLFAVVVALFVFVGNKAGTRAVGGVMIFGAAWQQLRGRIPYGWEGRKPSGFLTGGFATVVNLILAALGFSVLVWPAVAMDVLGWSSN